jgi:hypothetical protein
MSRTKRRVLSIIAGAALIPVGVTSAQALDIPGADAIEIPGAGWVVAEDGASQQDIEDAMTVARSPVMSESEVRAAVENGARTEALVDGFRPFANIGDVELIEGVKKDVQDALNAEWSAQRMNVSEAEIRALLEGIFAARVARQWVGEALTNRRLIESLAAEEARSTLLFTQSEVEVDEWQGVRVNGAHAAVQVTGRQRYVRQGGSEWEERHMRWRLFLAREQGAWRVDEWFAEQTDRRG